MAPQAALVEAERSLDVCILSTRVKILLKNVAQFSLGSIHYPIISVSPTRTSRFRNRCSKPVPIRELGVGASCTCTMPPAV